jgi:hypothetical protein
MRVAVGNTHGSVPCSDGRLVTRIVCKRIQRRPKMKVVACIVLLAASRSRAGRFHSLFEWDWHGFWDFHL